MSTKLLSIDPSALQKMMDIHMFITFDLSDTREFRKGSKICDSIQPCG